MHKIIGVLLAISFPAHAQTVVPPLSAAQTKASTRANLVGKLNDLLVRADMLAGSLQANRVTATDDAAQIDATALIVVRSTIYDTQCGIDTIDGTACAPPPSYYGKAVQLKNAISAQSAETPMKVWRLSGTLTVAGGLNAAGKRTQTVAIVGLASGDAVLVTPKASVPTSFTLGDLRASATDTIEVSVTFPQLVTLGAAVNIPLDVLAFR